jgi:hypothetical protein
MLTPGVRHGQDVASFNWTAGFSMVRSLLIVLMLATAACGNNRNATNEPNGAGDVDAGDSGPQCGPNQIVNGRGECISKCQRTEDCNDPTLVCNLDLGVCIPKPPECNPATCQAGMICPPAGQGVACIPLPAGACIVDGDCGILERCAGGECISRAGDVVATCVVNEDCPILMTCMLGVCVGCLDDLQCQLSASGGKCVLGTCVTADLGAPGECINKLCPDGQICALTTGQCTAKCTVATETTDCTADQRCLPVGNYCVGKFGCSVTEDCTAPLQCAAGLCIGCTDNDQCLPSEQCVQPVPAIPGACFPNLTGNVCDTVTCETAGDICDPANGSCYPSNGTCVDATDCRPGHTCNFLHLCAGCSVDGDCRANQRCLLATCIPIPSGG